MDYQFKKSELKPAQDIKFLGYQPLRGFGLSKPKENKQTSNSGGFHFAGSEYYSKEADVSDWGHGFHGEDSSFGSNKYETISVFPEDQLALSQSLHKVFSISQLIKDHLAWWMDPQNLLKASNLHQEQNMLLFTAASVKGWGTHFYNCTTSGV